MKPIIQIWIPEKSLSQIHRGNYPSTWWRRSPGDEKVRKHFIDFIIAINVFACILYLYISYFGMFTIQDAVAKIFLHGIVAIIIYTLTKNSFYEK
jgi:uncharacterized protein YggL (DUF469 family)